jgi:hypothetical protein
MQPCGTHERASARCLGARREGYAPALMAHFQHLQLGQRSSLLEDSSSSGWHQHPGGVAWSSRQRRQDSTLHERRTDGFRVLAHRWKALRREGIDAWMAQRRGTHRRRRAALERGRIWGKTGADRRAPFVSDGSVVTGWQASSRAQMSRGQRRAGPALEKMAHNGFSILNYFSN